MFKFIMEFFTRLSKNYIFFKNKKEYSRWTQWQGDLSPLDNINNYDTIFNNFGNHIDVTELINYKSSKKNGLLQMELIVVIIGNMRKQKDIMN